LDEINEQQEHSFEIETNSTYTYESFFSTRTNSTNISIESIQEYIRYPMIYNDILREISKQSYGLNGIYSQAINTRVSLPLLSHVVIPPKRSKKTKKDKTKDDENKRKINLKLRLMNHDKTTRDILRKLDIYGIYVGILRDTTASNKNITPSSGMIESIDKIEGLSLSDNFMIQPLDLDYCKIIGLQNNIAISAFDMMYFDQFKHGGLVNEIKNFPKDFLIAYNAYK
jgi:hypothetical protein